MYICRFVCPQSVPNLSKRKSVSRLHVRACVPVRNAEQLNTNNLQKSHLA